MDYVDRKIDLNHQSLFDESVVHFGETHDSEYWIVHGFFLCLPDGNLSVSLVGNIYNLLGESGQSNKPVMFTLAFQIYHFRLRYVLQLPELVLVLQDREEVHAKDYREGKD
jgi:hypothetical protein